MPQLRLYWLVRQSSGIQLPLVIGGPLPGTGAPRAPLLTAYGSRVTVASDLNPVQQGGSILEILIAVLVIAALCVGGYFYFKHKQKTGREEAEQEAKIARSEEKVEMSDLITRTDISILREADSPLLDQAIALRRRQVDQGRVED